MSQNSSEHGSMKSYVIGFILSLVFTFIPYYLVVNQKLPSNFLLAAILSFAVLQMLVQIFFFLHLGRGPKPLYNVVFFVSTISIVLIVVGGSIVIMNNLQYNMPAMEQSKKLANDEGIYQVSGMKTGACQSQGANHQIIVTNGQMSPLQTVANKCDSLTFLNEGQEELKIAFGTKAQHSSYAGEEELLVRIGRAKTITLSESGTFKFHDDLQADYVGEFRVNP